MNNFFKICLVFLLISVSSIFAAGEKGEGTCVVTPDEVITNKYLATGIAFTFITGNTGFSNGHIDLVWPNDWGTPVTTTVGGKVKISVAVTSTATTLGNTSIINEGSETLIRQIVTSANKDAYIIFTAQYVTIPATPGSQTFTFRSAADVTYTVASSDIAVSPSIYKWSNINPISITTVVPTPVVLTTLTSNISIKIKLTTSFTGGQLKLERNMGTPGYSKIVAVPTWNKTPSSDSYIRAISTPSIFAGSPTVYPTCVIIPIATAGAGVIIDVKVGNTGVPTVGPFGDKFVKGYEIKACANAIGTIVPTTTPIPVGTWSVWVPTPTIQMTVTTLMDGSKKVYFTGLLAANKVLYCGSEKSYPLIGSDSYTIVPKLPYGVYNYRYVMTYQDIWNEGATRTNTISTTVYEAPSSSEFEEAIKQCIITKEVVTGDSASPVYVTSYSQPQYVGKIEAIGNSSMVLARVIDGSVNTYNTLIIPSYTLNTFGQLDNPYILEANQVSRWYRAYGSPNTLFLQIYRLPLPTR